jgi:hypothetical protein
MIVRRRTRGSGIFRIVVRWKIGVRSEIFWIVEREKVGGVGLRIIGQELISSVRMQSRRQI